MLNPAEIFSENGFASNIRLLESQDALDLDWARYDAVIFYYTQPFYEQEAKEFQEHIQLCEKKSSCNESRICERAVQDNIDERTL